MTNNEERSSGKVLKNVLVSILLLFFIFTFFQQKQQINRLEETISAVELRLTNNNSFYPILQGFQLVREEPTKERFEMLHASLQNQHQYIESLIELNRHNLTEEQWTLYTESRYGQQATVYILNLASEINKLSADEWHVIEEIEEAWLTFANRVNQVIDVGNVNAKDLAYVYIELHKQLYTIQNKDSY